MLSCSCLMSPSFLSSWLPLTFIPSFVFCRSMLTPPGPPRVLHIRILLSLYMAFGFKLFVLLFVRQGAVAPFTEGLAQVFELRQLEVFDDLGVVPQYLANIRVRQRLVNKLND